MGVFDYFLPGWPQYQKTSKEMWENLDKKVQSAVGSRIMDILPIEFMGKMVVFIFLDSENILEIESKPYGISIRKRNDYTFDERYEWLMQDVEMMKRRYEVTETRLDKMREWMK